MSTEQKTKETVCTSDDAMVVVTTKVEVNKDQCFGVGNQTGDFVTQVEFRKYQKFIRLHVGKDIHYNYQLSDGATLNELGISVRSGNESGSVGGSGSEIIDNEPIKETVIVIYIYDEGSTDNNRSEFIVKDENERILGIENFVGKTISFFAYKKVIKF